MFWKKTGRRTNTTAQFPILFGLRFCNVTGSSASNVAGTGVCFHRTIPERCLSSTTSSIIRIEEETQSTISILSAMSIMMSSTAKPRDRNEKASETISWPMAGFLLRLLVRENRDILFFAFRNEIHRRWVNSALFRCRGNQWGHCLTLHLATGQFTGDGKDVFSKRKPDILFFAFGMKFIGGR